MAPKQASAPEKNYIYMQRKGCGEVWIIGLIRAKVEGEKMLVN